LGGWEDQEFSRRPPAEEGLRKLDLFSCASDNDTTNTVQICAIAQMTFFLQGDRLTLSNFAKQHIFLESFSAFIIFYFCYL